MRAGRAPHRLVAARVLGAALAACCAPPIVAFVAATVVTFAPSAARADEPVESARAHFEAGTRAFDAGDYDAAVGEFRTAYTLKPNAAVLINVALCYERIYKPDLALAAYEQFLAEAPPQNEFRPLAEKRLRILRQLPGSILVETNKDALVLLTGEHFHDTALGSHRWIDLPPGDYHVHISLAEHAPVDEDLHLVPGETQTLPGRLLHQREQLTIFSVPDGARVFLDDKEDGVTPYSRSIETGRGLRLRLEAADFPPYRETFNLEAGRPLYKRIHLPKPRHSGRTELVLAAMAYGGFASTSLAVSIGGSRVTTGTGLTVLIPTAIAGVGIGFLGAWALTSDDLKVGHSSIIIGSTFWGGTLGASLAFGLGLTAQDSQQNTLAVTLLGSGLGFGAGIVTSWLNDTSPGDAAIVNSGAMWGLLGGTLLTEGISFRKSDHDQAFGWLTLGTTASGLALGALLSHYAEVSRGHVAIVDAAGALGMVLGYGVGYAAGDDSFDADSGTVCPGHVKRCVTGARYALGGMAVGLLAASILTRKFKDDLPAMEALVTHHGDKWSLGVPRFRFNLARVPEGMAKEGIVDLARGEF